MSPIGNAAFQIFVLPPQIWRFFVLFVYMGLEVYPLLGMLWIIAPFCIEYRRQYLNRKGQPLALYDAGSVPMIAAR
mgnify:CR=1 FL=1